MTVIAGLWRFAAQADRPPPTQAVSTMLSAQLASSPNRQPDPPVVRDRGLIAVGATAGWPSKGKFETREVPRDLQFCAGETDPLCAIDARIDNRDELLEALGRRVGDTVDDAFLIQLTYRRWGSDFAAHVIGDFAVAIWDEREQTLTLARDVTGQRPLHYHRGDGFVAFSSMPAGLIALDDVSRRPDEARLAQFVADVPGRGSATFFADVDRVEPGQVVTITRRALRARQYWFMPTGELRLARDADYVEAFRAELDRAVAVRLRDGDKLVAAHLSAGLDSGAVAATAARLLAPGGGRVLAITSAPRLGFAGPVPVGRLADESGLAATLAAQFANIDHLVLRTTDRSPLSALAGDALLFGQPVGFPCNNLWWGAANAAARSGGACIMLTGELGNLSISAGGLGVLADYLRTGRWGAWLRELIALEKRGPRWRGLLAASFRPWLPPGLWHQLSRFSAGGQDAPPESLLAQDARRLLPPDPASVVGAGSSERDVRWALLQRSDPGNFRKGALLRWGVDERDPTADRRLIEFCFRLPPEQLLGGGVTRRLARAALGDRLPAVVLNGPRGYQFADWYETLDQASLHECAARIATDRTAAAVIDLAAVDRLVSAWPVNDWASAHTIGSYRIGLLRALSAGVFALNASA